MRKNKIPVVSLAPQNTGKTPRVEAAFGETADAQKPTWAFRILDLEGPWSWHNMTPAHFAEVLERFKSLESMTWAQIKQNTGSHHVDKGDLIKSARDRLIEIRQDDVDQLFSLRVSGERRIWGILDGPVLKILWWDAKHEICPSFKKHT